jgi:hypothetical protein
MRGLASAASPPRTKGLDDKDMGTAAAPASTDRDAPPALLKKSLGSGQDC